jgi:hypothetical protein
VGHNKWGKKNEEKGRRKRKVVEVNGTKLAMPKANKKVIRRQFIEKNRRKTRKLTKAHVVEMVANGKKSCANKQEKKIVKRV